MSNTDLKLGIDASGAKKGAAQFSSAISAIRNALSGLEKDSNGAFTSLRRGLQVTGGKGAETALTGTTKAASQTEAAMQRLATAQKNAMTTAGGQAAKLRAQFEALGNTSGIARVESALARLQSRAGSAGNTATLGAAKADFRSSVAGLTAEVKASQAAAKATALHSAELYKLKSQYDPLFASSKLYEKQLLDINRAEAAGVLTSVQATNARERAAQSLESGVVSMNRYGQSVRVSSAHMASATQGVVAQFNDIGVMLASGQSPLLLAMQQGTQLSQTLNSLGGGSGSVLSALKGGFMSLVNPVSLVTIGSIALGAALFQAVGKALPETISLSDAMDNLKTSTDELRAAAERSSGNWDEVRKDYGALTTDIMELVHAQRILAQVTASNDLSKARDALYSDQGGVGWLASLSGYADNAQGRIRRLRDEFDLTFEVATRMENLFQDSRSETSAANISNIYAQLRRELEMATDGFTNMTDEQRRLLEGLVAGEDAARRLAAATGDIAPNLAASANEAERLESALLRSMSLQNRSDVTTYGGRGEVNRWNYKEPGPGTKWDMSVITAREREQERAARAAAKTTKARVSASARMTNRLQAENIALNALKDGLFETSAAADMYAEAFLKSGGAVDSATMSALKQADAVAHANEQLRKIVQTNKSGGSLQEDVSKSMQQGLKSGLSSALQGDAQSFAQTLGDAVYNSVANSLADALVDSLFTKNAASGAGNIFTTALGWFGFGSEGGYSTDLPQSGYMPFSAFNNAPQYAEGTANTSNAIPAVLHPNEAVVPLSRGRKIPVDIGDAGGGGDSIVINSTVNVEGGAGDNEQAISIARRVEENIRSMMREEMATGMRYGGVMNPRGGRG